MAEPSNPIDQHSIQFMRDLARNIRIRIDEGVESFEEILGDAVERLLARVRDIERAKAQQLRSKEFRMHLLAAIEADVIERCEAVISAVARHFGLPMKAIMGRRRLAPLANARHIACYLIRELHPDIPLVDIAACMGRDHTSALHGINRTKDRMHKDQNVRAVVMALMEELRNVSVSG